MGATFSIMGVMGGPEMKAQYGLNTAQDFLVLALVNQEEVLVVGGRNRKDSWQDVPIVQQDLCHSIVSCEKWTVCMGNMAVLTN